MSIFNSIIRLVNNILDFFNLKQKAKDKEFDIVNSEENKQRKDRVKEIEIRDQAEELINKVQNGTEKEKQDALEEIRRRTSR